MYAAADVAGTNAAWWLPMTEPSTTEANKAAVRGFVEALNQGSLEGLADNYVEHDRAYPGETNSLEEVQAKMEQLSQALPDLTLTIEDMVAEGETVAVNATATATHDDEFYGVEPTGKRIEWAVTVFARVENEEVVEVWALRDVLGIMKQLELVPPVRPGGE